jgi:hypothetical protein
MQQCLDNQVQNALNIPYFEGDFWPNIIEECIKGMFLLLIIKNRNLFNYLSDLDQKQKFEDADFDDPTEVS